MDVKAVRMAEQEENAAQKSTYSGSFQQNRGGKESGNLPFTLFTRGKYTE